MNPIRWNEPRFGKEELDEIRKVIEANYVNEGPKTKELEEEFKKYLGAKYIVFTANATAALFLAIKAEAALRGIDDFEVIVPGLTMIATAAAVNWAGGKPVLVDVKKEDLTIDPLKIEAKISKKTIAIIPVHVLGRAADMPKILEIAEKHNLAVIEDAAGALGSMNHGKFLGTFGKAGCFSLQSNKIITSGQGGIIALNDEKLYEKIRRFRDFGRMSNKEFLHEIAGYNLKFSDLAAALANAQFKKLEARKNLLIEQFNQYKKNLSDLKQVKLFPLKEGEIPLWVDAIAENKKALSDFLASNQIFCRDCWPALHRNPPYMSQGSDGDFPNSSFASDNIIWFPNGPAVSTENINLICSNIKEFYRR